MGEITIRQRQPETRDAGVCYGANERRKECGKNRASNDPRKPKTVPAREFRGAGGRADFIQSGNRAGACQHRFVNTDIELLLEIEHEFDSIERAQPQLVERCVRCEGSVRRVFPENIDHRSFACDRRRGGAPGLYPRLDLAMP
jgi:hypothetical protein